VTLPPSDSALLDRFLRDGDDAALTALVDRVAPRLYRLARALTAWRVIGAKTVAERAWRAALARAGEVDGDAALWRVLLDEVVRIAAAVGDSPRPRHTEEPPPRGAAMRAVALLPSPARAVYALHEVGGADVAAIAEVLTLPEARVRAELWHARLTVETLAGGEHSPDAALWEEPTPPDLVERLLEGARHRRAIGGRHGRFPRSAPRAG
jgi:DNA-directed RNA polymerase specialized sigma24 family protein